MKPKSFALAVPLLLAGLLLAGLLLGSGSLVAEDSPYANAYKAGQDYEKAGKPADARKQFETALQRAASGVEKADAQIAIGRTYDAEKKHAEARAEYEKALAIGGITPEQTGQARFNIGASYVNGEYKYQPGFQELEKVIALEGASTKNKVEANMLIARAMAGYNHVWAWPRAVTAYNSILAMPDITPVQRLAAQRGLIEALIGLKKYADARRVMTDIVTARDLPAKDRVETQILIGKMCLLGRSFADARAELEKVLVMEGISDADKADIQLHLALSYYDAQDYERAKPELLKVLTMPSANARLRRPTRNCSYSPAGEADLRLRLRKMVPADGPSICVLLIGSSMITRGDMPCLLAEMSASAPAGRPRIISGLFARNATKIDAFWDDGDDTPETARSIIAAEPWDAVLMETFYSMSHDDFVKYGTLFADLVRSRKAKLVFYASPVAKEQPYPEGYRKFQDEIVALGRTLSAPVAPAAGAYLNLLGPAPTPEQFNVVYADWIHPTEKGNYVIACCLYAALTGAIPWASHIPAFPRPRPRRFRKPPGKHFRILEMKKEGIE